MTPYDFLKNPTCAACIQLGLDSGKTLEEAVEAAGETVGQVNFQEMPPVPFCEKHRPTITDLDLSTFPTVKEFSQRRINGSP